MKPAGQYGYILENVFINLYSQNLRRGLMTLFCHPGIPHRIQHQIIHS